MQQKEQQNEPISQKDWDTCIKVLQRLSRYPDDNLDEMMLKGLVTKLYKKAKKRKKNSIKTIRKAADEKLKQQTYIFQRNDETTSNLPILSEVTTHQPQHFQKPISCYICKQLYTEIHSFYHQLCPTCGDFNFKKRQQTTNLNGRIAILTGGRIKIGLKLALNMLRDGANVIVTTRFPEDARLRYQTQSDYEDWKDRVHIYGLDLRHLPSVETFINWVQKHFSHLDIIINNAAQTVKRPLAFYQHLITKEENNYLLEAEQSTTTLLPFNPDFPIGQFNKDQQQIDLRTQNSWTTKLDEVATLEMLEVQLVNVTAPFLLNSRLKNMLEKSPFERKFIVNVSAMEGQFSKKFKTIYHPHTNMAKAALNMMTKTSAADYAQSNIYMTSVDTGWITDENPHPKKSRMRERGFVTPLDIVDGAMRVYEPIVLGLNVEDCPPFGVFLKDYRVVDW